MRGANWARFAELNITLPTEPNFYNMQTHSNQGMDEAWAAQISDEGDIILSLHLKLQIEFSCVVLNIWYLCVI